MSICKEKCVHPTRNFRTLRSNIFMKTKNFENPPLPVHMGGPRSNLLNKKMVENLVTLCVNTVSEKKRRQSEADAG